MAWQDYLVLVFFVGGHSSFAVHNQMGERLCGQRFNGGRDDGRDDPDAHSLPPVPLGAVAARAVTLALANGCRSSTDRRLHALVAAKLRLVVWQSWLELAACKTLGFRTMSLCSSHTVHWRAEACERNR